MALRKTLAITMALVSSVSGWKDPDSPISRLTTQSWTEFLAFDHLPDAPPDTSRWQWWIYLTGNGTCEGEDCGSVDLTYEVRDTTFYRIEFRRPLLFTHLSCHSKSSSSSVQGSPTCPSDFCRPDLAESPPYLLCDSGLRSLTHPVLFLACEPAFNLAHLARASYAARSRGQTLF